jgi:hypothetical protein
MIRFSSFSIISLSLIVTGEGGAPGYWGPNSSSLLFIFYLLNVKLVCNWLWNICPIILVNAYCVYSPFIVRRFINSKICYWVTRVRSIFVRSHLLHMWHEVHLWMHGLNAVAITRWVRSGCAIGWNKLNIQLYSNAIYIWYLECGGVW